MNYLYHISPRSTSVCLLLLLLCVALPANAQFVHSLGGTSFDLGVEVEMDKAGNAYFVGNFRDTLDFDPGAGQRFLANNNTDAFVASYDPLGTMRFAFSISGPFASHESVGDIAVAPDGFFVITGHQPFGYLDFDPDPMGELGTSGNFFIAGYNSNGEVQFAVSPAGGENTSNGNGYAVTLDEDDNVYVTGHYVTALDFNPADTTGVLANNGNSDVFIASYTKTGAYRYAYGFGGPSLDYGAGIAVDSQKNVYVAGFFVGEVAFDPEDKDGDGDTEIRVAESLSDMYLVSYDDAGRFRFVYTYDTANRIVIERKVELGIDAADNIYMSGESVGVVAYDPEDADGDGDLVQRSADALGSAFLASYKPTGELRFANVFKGGTSESKDVFTDKDGVSFITGSHIGEVDFDPGLDTAIISSTSGSDVFVASYDSLGAFRTMFSLPSTGLSGGHGVAFDSLYNVVLTGGFGGELDVDYSTGEDIRFGAGQNDIFMARFSSGGQVSVSTESVASLPSGFTVSAPYPNPFASRVNMQLDVASSQHVAVEVYDLLGRQVASLHNAVLPAGKHNMTWDGAGAVNGVYFIRIVSGATQHTERAVLMR
ncbi:MAG: T9SS type A sorting domain-containing protein [Bacteroidota bacterium]